MNQKTQIDDINDFELPIDPDYYSPPPRLSMEAYCDWCEWMHKTVSEREKKKPLASIPEFTLD